MPLTKKPITRQWFYNASYGANDYREREETFFYYSIDCLHAS